MKSILITSIILVHSWYPNDCCNGQDCFPVPCGELKQVQTGWEWVKNHMIFTKEKMRSSQDEGCHICIAGNQPRCIFLPGSV